MIYLYTERIESQSVYSIIIDNIDNVVRSKYFQVIKLDMKNNVHFSWLPHDSHRSSNDKDKQK